MKRVFLLILLLFTSFASLQAQKLGEFHPYDPNKIYVITENPDGTIVGKPKESPGWGTVVVAGLALLLVGIFGGGSGN